MKCLPRGADDLALEILAEFGEEECGRPDGGPDGAHVF